MVKTLFGSSKYDFVKYHTEIDDASTVMNYGCSIYCQPSRASLFSWLAGN